MQLEEFSVALAPAKFSDDIPFSFIYDGKPSSDLLPNWQQSRVRTVPSPGKQRETVTFTDPATGLEVTCETTTFNDFSAVDWVVYLRNKGSTDTPIIESIRAMDLHIIAPSPAPVEGEITFHHSHGSTCTATDFLPIDDLLAPNSEFDLAPVDGRSSDTTLPFLNLEWPGGGVVGAVGWSGQWAMSVRRDAGSGVTLQAGQQTTHLRLHPGETIRTPRILLSAWRASDPIQGNNRFRRLLLAHYLPKVNGEVVVPPVTQNTWFTYTGNGVNEENQLEMIRTAAAVGVECYWLDAGWFEGGWPNGAGSWVPRTDAFPHGLKALADAAHAKGMKFVLWFEPERVCPGTRIATEHPDWVMHVLPGDETPSGQDWPGDEKPSGQDLNENRLFSLGNPEARRWMTDMLSKCIEDWGVGIYRQDFNIFGAKYFWKAADAPDRQGMAENQHIQGLYAMWDDLLKRHPGLVIDNCASGGRRIDLELLSRSIPLWRSDTQCVGRPMPIQDQVQTAGLSLYVPLHSASVWTFDPYEWRSVATTGANLCMDHRSPNFDKAGAKRAISEVKELRQLWLGDYYPLAGINADEAQWCGWQFDRPDLGRGFAMYFRRPKSRCITLESGLRGLDQEAVYEVTFADRKTMKTMTGREFATMPVTVRKAPGSVLITYKKRS